VNKRCGDGRELLARALRSLDEVLAKFGAIGMWVNTESDETCEKFEERILHHRHEKSLIASERADLLVKM
jgi:hypothetical protein